MRGKVKDIGLQAILKLLRLAWEMESLGNSTLSKRYVDLALRISKRVRVRIPRYWRRRICRKCRTILIPGKTCRVRIKSQGRRSSHITVTCLKCGWIRRYYIKGGSHV